MNNASLEAKTRASEEMASEAHVASGFDATKITRPDDSLLTYYFIVSLLTTVAFPFFFAPLFIRFKTMEYRFDDKGVAMRWGFFFRKEVYLTYARLQDIHVTRNIIERWMGLAKVPLQTASGTAGATMRIEGIRDPAPLRDFLYLRMRDVADDRDAADDDPRSGTQLLREIRDELKRKRINGEAVQ